MKAEDAYKIYSENIDYEFNKIMAEIFSKIETLALQGNLSFQYDYDFVDFPVPALRIKDHLESLGYIVDTCTSRGRVLAISISWKNNKPSNSKTS